jgi:glycosyltransferase involved in cell wall biosynthesis
MNVLVVSGIWPPDVGGPASHAPALAFFLLGRGHRVEVVTTAQEPPAPQPYPVAWVSRRLPAGLRHVRSVLAIRRAAVASDVVYATGMVRRAALGALLARRPLVVKLVADEAYERARRSSLFDGTLEEFQRVSGGVRLRALRVSRNRALARAEHVFCPSAYLRGIALGWGLDPGHVTVLPNPAPRLPDLPDQAEARAALGLTGPLLAFAGRLTAQKDLEVALAAMASLPGVRLAVLGDGPERGRLERRAAELGLDGRVRFLGGGGRDDVLTLFRAADAVVLSSSWENFPHTVVEALAVGTPVVATAVGGVSEVVRDGENGLLVPPRDAGALAAALRRLVDEPGLRGRLAAAAAPSVELLAEELLLAVIEERLEAAAVR